MSKLILAVVLAATLGLAVGVQGCSKKPTSPKPTEGSKAKPAEGSVAKPAEAPVAKPAEGSEVKAPEGSGSK